MSSLENKILEHVVLVKIKPGVESTTLIDTLNRLSSIEVLIHFSAGELLRSSHGFTHIIHCRFRSKEDLQSFATNPHHLSLHDDFMALFGDVTIVDWFSSNVDSPKPGSAMRVTLLKLKHESNKSAVIEGIKNQFKGIEEGIVATSVGENILQNEMDKKVLVGVDIGYSIGSIAIVPGPADFAVLDTKVDHHHLQELVESEVVVDYVFPSAN